MKTRKIILLSICAFLLCVCIAQGITGSISPVKTIKTDADPDTITISNSNSSVTLTHKNNYWYVGNNNYIATAAEVDNMLKAVKEIKVLDKIGKFGSALDERYNLTDEKATTVIATKDGKEVALLRIGKTSSTGSQTYACINGKTDILLLSGNLTSIFGKDEASLRSKTIYTIEEENVAAAEITMGTRTWGLENSAKKGEKAVWQITGNSPKVDLDQEAAQAWIRNVCFLNINSWIEDNTDLPANKLTSFSLKTTGGETILVDIYEKKTGNDSQYIGTCSRTPHKFDLTKYLTEKFTKQLDELKTKAEA
ncbi:MAG: DUF4340 domain-containing protein [Treponema sp.]|nr:DUF4340 domain-containing protein [Treponema sp.]